MRLAGALWPFWLMRGNIVEGGRRLETALAAYGAVEARLSGPPSNELLADLSWALTGAGAMAEARGDYAGSCAYLERSLSVRRAMGDKKFIAAALHNLAQAVRGEGDLVRARQLIEESLAIHREVGNKTGLANSLGTLGTIAYSQGDYAAALSYFEECLALCRELHKLHPLANNLNDLGSLLLQMGEHARARALLEESLALARELGDRPLMGEALDNLGQLAADQGDFSLAISLQKESLDQYRQADHLRVISQVLAHLALALGALGHAEEASRLLGASEAARVATHYQLTPADKGRIERGLATIRSNTQIDHRHLEAAYNEGLTMTLEQAIDSALQA
ncbi:MAG: tetratricopeptide repeat protein [Chloroflexia bacterium]